jgi:hypothetical protein
MALPERQEAPSGKAIDIRDVQELSWCGAALYLEVF